MFGMIIGILFALYLVVAVLDLVGVIIGAVFSGICTLLGGMLTFSYEGLVIGIVLGIVLYFIRKRKMAAE